MRFSTGCVDDYGNPRGNLAHSVQAGATFRAYCWLAGFTQVSAWVNGDVWGEDFIQGTDLAPDGGSDVPELYMYQGHGICTPGPRVGDEMDVIVLHPNGSHRGHVAFGKESRWGEGAGNLRFLILNASCPMGLATLAHSWFPCFRGLHMAVGHSGDSAHDTLDDRDRAGMFAAWAIPFASWFPNLSVGDAWMQTGLQGVMFGTSAVALAAGNDRNDAIDRRDHEKVTDNRPKPAPNWFAWKWVTL